MRHTLPAARVGAVLFIASFAAAPPARGQAATASGPNLVAPLSLDPAVRTGTLAHGPRRHHPHLEQAVPGHAARLEVRPAPADRHEGEPGDVRRHPRDELLPRLVPPGTDVGGGRRRLRPGGDGSAHRGTVLSHTG